MSSSEHKPENIANSRESKFIHASRKLGRGALILAGVGVGTAGAFVLFPVPEFALTAGVVSGIGVHEFLKKRSKKAESSPTDNS